MWKCEKCGEEIEDQFDSCWKCTPVRVEPEAEDPAEPTGPRPAGITVLAALQCSSAVFFLVIGIICLFGPKAAKALFSVLNHALHLPSSFAWLISFVIALFFFLGSGIFYLFARGLWQVKNWARLWTLGFAILNLVNGGPSFLGPFNFLIPTGVASAILNRICNFLLIVYLLSPGVRNAFAPTAPLRRWLLPAAVALGLCSMSFDLYQSKSEIRALQWHLRHGDRAGVNGVSFPIYYWYAPGERPDGLNLGIDDTPGPLRPGDDSAWIQIKGYREGGDDLSAEQLVDRRVGEDRKSGFTVEKFRLLVGTEAMTCSRKIFRSTIIDCYGDGPIYSVYFNGDTRSLDRFTRMMAGARN